MICTLGTKLTAFLSVRLHYILIQAQQGEETVAERALLKAIKGIETVLKHYIE